MRIRVCKTSHGTDKKIGNSFQGSYWNPGIMMHYQDTFHIQSIQCKEFVHAKLCLLVCSCIVPSKRLDMRSLIYATPKTLTEEPIQNFSCFLSLHTSASPRKKNQILFQLAWFHRNTIGRKVLKKQSFCKLFVWPWKQSQSVPDFSRTWVPSANTQKTTGLQHVEYGLG